MSYSVAPKRGSILLPDSGRCQAFREDGRQCKYVGNYIVYNGSLQAEIYCEEHDTKRLS